MTHRLLTRLTRRQNALGWCVLIAAGCNNAAPPVVETPPPAVTVSQPLTQKVVDYDSYEGRFAAVDSVDVRARVRGHVMKINFKDGQLVKQGDTLYEIDARFYKAELDSAKAQLAAADASLELAKKEYERSAALFKTRAASQAEVDVWAAKQGVAAGERLKAVAALERAQLDLDFTKVAAPMSGKVSRSQVSVGNLINSSGGETLLTTIVSVDPFYVYFDIDERALLRYRQVFRKANLPANAQPSVKELKIPLELGLEGEIGFPHRGEIDFTDNRVNPSTGTIQVRGVVPNPLRNLEAGMRARVRVPIGDARDSILVTERAIGSDQGRKFVYVVNEQNIVERRDVVLDMVTEGLQVVRQGIKPEDWVIVNGIQRVREASKVDPKRVAMPGSAAEKNAAPAAKN